MHLGIPSLVNRNFSTATLAKELPKKRIEFPHPLGYNDTQASSTFILRIARWFPRPPR